MKIDAQIEALENLAELDAQLKILDDELEQERQNLGQKKDQLAMLDQRIQASRSSIAEMDRTRGELVQEARQMSVQMEKSREKLGRCRTEREVNAAQREIEELRKLFRDREQEIEKLSAFSSQAKSELEGTVAEREALAGELGSSEGQVTSRLHELDQDASTKREARKGLVAKVQPVLFRRYELIRKRRAGAIAHVTDGTCSACHMRIPPMMFQQLMRLDDFQQCPSCNRIIYYRPPAAEGEVDAAESQSSGP